MSSVQREGMPYLEESVLPMDKWDWTACPSAPGLPAEGRAVQGAAHHYRLTIQISFSAPARRKCPDCRESALRPRQRVCEGCSKRRRKTSHAMAVRKWRGTKGSDVHQLTKISP